MISSTPTVDKTGKPVDGSGKKLTVSAYQPPVEIIKLFGRVQNDYQLAWRLQHRPFKEFDGISLLDRTRVDQETFGAFVGAVYDNDTNSWRWKGRKNTARNKIIGIAAHLISGMLFPYCYAYNDENEDDELTAKVMAILIEDHLKKAKYELKFLFMVISALVNPAVFVEVEYIEAMQRIKEKMADGKYRITQVVDDFLSGIGINLVPIDQVLLADFYTNDNQRQPFMIRVRRISYDEAREIHAGKWFDKDGKDLFDYVEAGKTRVWLAGQENQTLYDIDWTEADQNYVQELTIKYRPEDLELTWVTGVGMFNYDDPYNSNPFKHRRMSMIGDEFKSIPIYNVAKSGFEPIDPTGRFAYYKSAAFKEFWDDAGLNRMFQLAYDASYLDTIKPTFMTGVSKIDGSVMVPGATIGMPIGAQITPYSMGPNIPAVMKVMEQTEKDLSDSTQDNTSGGQAQPGVTATGIVKAQQAAQTMIGPFALLISDLVHQIGDLTVDCIIQHTTVGEIDASIPEALNMKFQTLMVKGKNNGKDITNKIEFDSGLMGMNLTKEKANDMEWDMHKKVGGVNSKMIHYKVNPYKFARTQFTIEIDPNMIVSRSMGTDQLRKDRAFNLLMDPRVLPYVNPQAVVDKFVLEEYSDGDPDEFKPKPGQQQQGQQQGQGGGMLNSVMGNPSMGVQAGMTAPQQK